MVCSIDISEKPKLNDPILIEGLPGIGFVANIAALHLIKELKAKTFHSNFLLVIPRFCGNNREMAEPLRP